MVNIHVIEGIDGTGKSTYISTKDGFKISAVNKSEKSLFDDLKSPYNKAFTFLMLILKKHEYLRKVVPEFKYDAVYFDRWLFSTLAYQTTEAIFNKKYMSDISRIEHLVKRYMTQHIVSRNDRIIVHYIMPDFDLVKENLEKEKDKTELDQRFSDLSFLKSVHYRYMKYLREYQDWFEIDYIDQCQLFGYTGDELNGKSSSCQEQLV